MKNYKHFIRRSFTVITFLVATLLLTSCSSTELKIKNMILAKEHRMGRLVSDICVLNLPEHNKSLFTVSYVITTVEKEKIKDSIRINRTMDEILSEFRLD